jgi:hypothetical protein
MVSCRCGRRPARWCDWVIGTGLDVWDIVQRRIVTPEVGDSAVLAEAMRWGTPTHGIVCLPQRFPLGRPDIGPLVWALLEAKPPLDAIMKRATRSRWTTRRAIEAHGKVSDALHVQPVAFGVPDPGEPVALVVPDHPASPLQAPLETRRRKRRRAAPEGRKPQVRALNWS